MKRFSLNKVMPDLEKAFEYINNIDASDAAKFKQAFLGMINSYNENNSKEFIDNYANYVHVLQNHNINLNVNNPDYKKLKPIFGDLDDLANYLDKTVIPAKSREEREEADKARLTEGAGRLGEILEQANNDQQEQEDISARREIGSEKRFQDERLAELRHNVFEAEQTAKDKEKLLRHSRAERDLLKKIMTHTGRENRYGEGRDRELELIKAIQNQKEHSRLSSVSTLLESFLKKSKRTKNNKAETMYYTHADETKAIREMVKERVNSLFESDPSTIKDKKLRELVKVYQGMNPETDKSKRAKLKQKVIAKGVSEGVDNLMEELGITPEEYESVTFGSWLDPIVINTAKRLLGMEADPRFKMGSEIYDMVKDIYGDGNDKMLPLDELFMYKIQQEMTKLMQQQDIDEAKGEVKGARTALTGANADVKQAEKAVTRQENEWTKGDRKVDWHLSDQAGLEFNPPAEGGEYKYSDPNILGGVSVHGDGKSMQFIVEYFPDKGVYGITPATSRAAGDTLKALEKERKGKDDKWLAKYGKNDKQDTMYFKNKDDIERFLLVNQNIFPTYHQANQKLKEAINTFNMNQFPEGMSMDEWERTHPGSSPEKFAKKWYNAGGIIVLDTKTGNRLMFKSTEAAKNAGYTDENTFITPEKLEEEKKKRNAEGIERRSDRIANEKNTEHYLTNDSGDKVSLNGLTEEEIQDYKDKGYNKTVDVKKFAPENRSTVSGKYGTFTINHNSKIPEDVLDKISFGEPDQEEYKKQIKKDWKELEYKPFVEKYGERVANTINAAVSKKQGAASEGEIFANRVDPKKIEQRRKADERRAENEKKKESESKKLAEEKGEGYAKKVTSADWFDLINRKF